MNEVDKYILDVTTKALDQEVLVEFSDLKKCDLVITQYNNLFDYVEKYVFPIEKLSLVVSILISIIFLKEKVNKKQIIGIIIIVIGTSLLFF